MRVSKTVREYIEKQVGAKFPKTENELQYEQNQNLVQKANDEIAKRLKQAKTEIIKAVGAEYGITEEIAVVQYEDRYSSYQTKVRDLADKDRYERDMAVQEKISDIIVELELGGTKADLERLLAEI